MSKKNKPKPLKQPAVSKSASPEPDFRTNPSGWIGWNMKIYGNDFETATQLLCQRYWLITAY